MPPWIRRDTVTHAAIKMPISGRRLEKDNSLDSSDVKRFNKKKKTQVKLINLSRSTNTVCTASHIILTKECTTQHKGTKHGSTLLVQLNMCKGCQLLLITPLIFFFDEKGRGRGVVNCHQLYKM